MKRLVFLLLFASPLFAQQVTVTSQPQNVAVTVGQPATFSATLSDMCRTAWYQDGALLGYGPLTNSPSYTLAATTSAESGDTFYVGAWGCNTDSGTASSQTVTLTVNPAPPPPPPGPSTSAGPVAATPNTDTIAQAGASIFFTLDTTRLLISSCLPSDGSCTNWIDICGSDDAGGFACIKLNAGATSLDLVQVKSLPTGPTQSLIGKASVTIPATTLTTGKLSP